MTIAYDTKTAKTRSRATPSVTFTHTCGAGTKLLILTIVVDGSTDRTGGAPTYNSVTMTQIATNGKAVTSPETVVEMWYLLNPGIGSAYTVTVPDAGNLYLTMETASFTANAANKHLVLNNSETATATGANPTSKTYTGMATGDLMLAIVGNGATTWVGTSLTGTIIYNVDDGSYGSGAQYYITTGTGNQAIGWTFGTSEDWAEVSGVFREVNEYTQNATGTASYTLTAQALHFDHTIAITYRAIAATSQTVGLNYGHKLTITYCAYTDTSQTLTLKANRKLKAYTEDYTSITYAGQDITYAGEVIRWYTGTGTSTSFTFSYQTLTFAIGAAGGNHTLAITHISLTLAFQTVSFTTFKGISVTNLGITLALQTLLFGHTSLLPVTYQTFTLTPQVYNSLYGRNPYISVDVSYLLLARKNVVLPRRNLYWHTVSHFI